jgi:hypothetical protein
MNSKRTNLFTEMEILIKRKDDFKSYSLDDSFTTGFKDSRKVLMPVNQRGHTFSTLNRIHKR